MRSAPPRPEQASHCGAAVRGSGTAREDYGLAGRAGRIVVVDLESNTELTGVESLVNQAGEWVVVAANEVSE